MIKFALLFVLLLSFIVLWKLIAKGVALFANAANEVNSMAARLDSLPVFSATTANNREAEFIDEPLPEQRQLIRLLRALLIAGFLLSAGWIILFWKTN